jgi:hypothetical protein
VIHEEDYSVEAKKRKGKKPLIFDLGIGFQKAKQRQRKGYLPCLKTKMKELGPKKAAYPYTIFMPY